MEDDEKFQGDVLLASTDWAFKRVAEVLRAVYLNAVKEGQNQQAWALLYLKLLGASFADNIDLKEMGFK